MIQIEDDNLRRLVTLRRVGERRGRRQADRLIERERIAPDGAAGRNAVREQRDPALVRGDQRSCVLGAPQLESLASGSVLLPNYRHVSIFFWNASETELGMAMDF